MDLPPDLLSYITIGFGARLVVASSLLARGSDPRLTVGTVNAVGFFVTLSAALVFLLTHRDMIAGLAIGGVVAAPIGAWLVRRVRPRPVLAVVGVLVIGISLRTLWAQHAGG